MKAVQPIVKAMKNSGSWLADQAGRLVNLNQWRSATSWRDRFSAVSWPRASVLGLAVTAVAGVVMWTVVQPHGLRAHAPRLPTEQEWRANQQAEDAMKAELSPALAAANRSVTPETP